MKKKKRIKTIFDAPILESKEKFQEIAECIYNIVGSPKFADVSAKIPVPVGATQKDIQEMVKKYAPKKIKDIFSLLLEDSFDDIVRICSLIFCQSFDEYKMKSVNQIIEDFSLLSKDEVSRIFAFFTLAG